MRFVFPGVALLLLAAPASAQRKPPLPHWTPAFGLHFGGPTRAAFALGTFVLTKAGDTDAGYVLLLEPGLGGGKVRAGIASVGAFVSGLSVEAVGLRTWGKPKFADTESTYAGGELHLLAFSLNLGLGTYVPVSQSQGQTRFAALTGGIGF